MAGPAVPLEIVGDEAGPPQADLWLGAGTAVLALAVAAAIARRRGGMTGGEPPRRLLRVLYPSLLLSGATTLWLVAGELWNPSATGPLPLLAAFAVLFFCVVGFVLFGILDFWLGLARPRRTRGWLSLAIFAFAVEMALVLAATMLAYGTWEEVLHPANAASLALAAACGIVWWAWLPASEPEAARVFE